MVQNIIRNSPTLNPGSCFSWIYSTFPCDGSCPIKACWHAVSPVHLIFKMTVLLALDFTVDLGFDFVRNYSTVFNFFWTISIVLVTT